MSVRVLIVDDSGFFRRRLTEILNDDPLIEVIGAAVDGKEAIAQAKSLKPDVITMDIEMPVMNGIDATRTIMRQTPTSILMFSSLTYDGATATLEALEAGAADFLPKRFEDISNKREEALTLLRNRVKTLGRSSRSLRTAVSTTSATSRPLTSSSLADKKPVTPPPKPSKPFKLRDFDLIAIGTSTGGPVALQTVLTAIPASYPVPILMIQHMPPKFTEAFANRLDKLCKINVREAKQGDKLEAGVALIAPGGMQLDVVKKAGSLSVNIKESTPDQNYKPCVDLSFESIAMSVGSRVLGIILTGMGADGRDGARRMKQTGATIWAQDEKTSLIYGMPAAVAQANLADQILPLPEIARILAGT